MAQFERLMTPSEQEVAVRLKGHIADVQDNPRQVVTDATSALVSVSDRNSVFVLLVLPAAAGFPEAQGADPTSHRQQRAAVREGDPAGQTAGLQQRWPPLHSNANANHCVSEN